MKEININPIDMRTKILTKLIKKCFNLFSRGRFIYAQ